jgi:hypothetical protein
MQDESYNDNRIHVLERDLQSCLKDVQKLKRDMTYTLNRFSSIDSLKQDGSNCSIQFNDEDYLNLTARLERKIVPLIERNKILKLVRMTCFDVVDDRITNENIISNLQLFDQAWKFKLGPLKKGTTLPEELKNIKNTHNDSLKVIRNSWKFSNLFDIDNPTEEINMIDELSNKHFSNIATVSSILTQLWFNGKDKIYDINLPSKRGYIKIVLILNNLHIILLVIQDIIANQMSSSKSKKMLNGDDDNDPVIINNINNYTTYNNQSNYGNISRSNITNNM